MTSAGSDTYAYDGNGNGNMTGGAGFGPENLAAIRTHTRTGRPLGAEPFLARLEKRLDRRLRNAKPGAKGKSAKDTRTN